MRRENEGFDGDGSELNLRSCLLITAAASSNYSYRDLTRIINGIRSEVLGTERFDIDVSTCAKRLNLVSTCIDVK